MNTKNDSTIYAILMVLALEILAKADGLSSFPEQTKMVIKNV